MALSGIASDDCHVTTETQLEEVEKRKPGPLWGSASSNQKKAAGAEILFYVPFPPLGLWGVQEESCLSIPMILVCCGLGRCGETARI